MKTVFISGSPKKHFSASDYFLKLQGAFVRGQAVFLKLRNKSDHAKALEQITDADAVVFSMPLYVDGPPSHVLAFLMDMENFCKEHRLILKIYVISNNGFIEGKLYGDNVIEKHGIRRDRTGDREKTRYLCGKQGVFTRDRALIRPGFIRQLETRASTRSASFFHALGGPGRPHNGGGAAGAYRTRNGAKPLKQGHLRAKRGPLGPSRKSQQQTKRTGFAAHGHSIAETAPEGKRASCANGALIRA